MRLLSSLCVFAMVILTSSCAKQIETKTEIAPFRETLAIDFGRGTQGVRTQNNYAGPIAIQVEGIGQAAGRSWSDAFYIYTDNDGNAIEPWHPAEFYNWTLWINGEPVDTLVSSIPEYNPDHIYIFVINAPGGKLKFAVGDTATGDNAGSYIISILE